MNIISSRRDAAVLTGFVLIFSLAVVSRLFDLGSRAMHHDESLHAEFAWRYFIGLGYEHDPMMHGPLLFHLICGSFLIFGDSEFTARLPSVIAGVVLVFSPILLKDQLGKVGVLAASLFLTISPSLLYYSRFARNDLLVCLATVLVFVSAWKIIQKGNSSSKISEGNDFSMWYVVLSLSLSSLFLLKELSYIVAALLLLYLNFALAHEWSVQRRGREPELRSRIWDAFLLIPSSWVIASLWPFARRLRNALRLGWRPEANLVVLVGTLVLPLLGASVRLIFPNVPDVAILVIIGGLTIAAIVVGLCWNPKIWLITAAAFYVPLILFYSTFFTNELGYKSLFWDSLSYWIDQQEVRRGTQPWYYYLLLVPLYEILPLILTTIGAGYLALTRQLSRFTVLLLVWAFGCLTALTFAGEKMPWLLTHIATPVCFLAGFTANRIFRYGVKNNRLAITGVLLASLLSLPLAFTMWTNYGLNIKHSDTSLEPLIYTQSSPDIPKLASEIERGLVAGTISGITVDTDEALSWPWAWYLRGKSVSYRAGDDIRSRSYIIPPDHVAILSAESNVLQRSILGNHGASDAYMHRWWFDEQTYRNLQWVDLIRIADWPRHLKRLTSFAYSRGDTPHGVTAYIAFPKK